MTQTLARPVPLLGPNPTEQEWLAARRTGIGGSDVAAVIGVSQHDGPVKVYYSKLGVLPDQDNAAMEWGRRLEDSVRQKFADEHPELRVVKGPGLVAHLERRWQLATVDGLVYKPDSDEPDIYEGKTGNSRDEEWGEPGTDEVPLSYVCQSTWYMDLWQARRTYLSVLIDGRDYREYVIEYDPVLAAKLRAHCDLFWHYHVLQQIPPDPDGLESTTEALEAVHSPKPKTKGELGPDALGWARIYGNAHRDVQAAQARKDEAGNHLRAAFIAAGSPYRGLSGGRKIASFSKPEPKLVEEFELERFAAEHPDLYQQYLTPKIVNSSPRLTLAREFTS